MRYDKIPQRGTGKRLGDERTLTEVLWLVVSKPDIKKSLLTEEAQQDLKLVTGQTIEDKLTYLEEQKIIYNKPEYHGEKAWVNHYFGCQSYHAFTYSYDLFKRKHKQTGFMKTPYYTHYTSSRDFLSKLHFNIYRSNLIALDDYIKQKNGLDTIINNVKKSPPAETRIRDIDEREAEAHKKFLQSLLRLDNNNTADPFVRNYTQHIQELRDNDIDALPAVFSARLSQIKNIGFDPRAYLNYLTEYMIPDYEQQNMAIMLRLSPTAIETTLNPKYPSPNLLANMAGLMLNTRIPSSFFKPIAPYEIEMLFNEDTSPLYSTAKSAFLVDLKNDNLVIKEGAEPLINLVLSQKRVTRIRTQTGEIKTIKTDVEK